MTTIAPDYSGWEGWNLRANWPFFQQLYENYTPIARSDQHVLWVRSEPGSKPPGPATCRIAEISSSALALEIEAPSSGLASVSVNRREPFARGRTALLTVSETSPETLRTPAEPWGDYPRYGVGNAKALSLVAPVEAGTVTRLRLAVMDGADIGSASCSAGLYDPIDLASLPRFPEGIERYLAGIAR